MAEETTINQENFVETPYEDASWEIIGELSETQEFVPLAAPVLASESALIDPMFADYGGRSESKGQQRWHLPTDLAGTIKAETDSEAAEREEREAQARAEELEAARRGGYEQGLAAAREQLKSEHDQELRKVASSLETVCADLNQQIDERLQGIEKSAVSLAVEIANKLVAHAVEINPEYIVEILHEALRRAGGAAIHKIRLSPQDFEFIQVVGLSKSLKDGDAEWKFEPDETVRSGCILESSAGQVDFRLDESWERIRDAVMKVVK